MPRRPATLTSPAPCGAFLYPSAYPFNGPAFTPFPSHLGPLPLRGASLALPCCHPFPPRLGQARALGRQPYALALGKPRLVAELNPLPSPFPLPSGHCRPIGQARPAPPFWGKRKDTYKR